MGLAIVFIGTFPGILRSRNMPGNRARVIERPAKAGGVALWETAKVVQDVGGPVLKDAVYIAAEAS